MVAVLALAVSGCRAIDGPDSNFFGEDCNSTTRTIYGCVDLQGRVTDSHGAPLENIDVGPLPGSETGGLEPAYVNTAADGTFELRLLQTLQNSPATVPLSLKATLRNNAGTELSSRALTIQVAITPPDQTPEPVTVNFTIPPA